MHKPDGVFPSASHNTGKRNNRLTMLLLMLSLLIVLALAGGGSPPAAGAVGGPVCFSVADGTSDAQDSSEVDSLVMIDLETGQGTFLGQTTSNADIEASEYDESSGKLFAIDGDIFGEISLTTGEFTGSVDLGTCVYGPGDSAAINDADGLAKDLATGDWYGTARYNNSADTLPDALFKLQLNTDGTPKAPIDPNGFGTGISCVRIPFAGIGGQPDLVDDIGFNQANGKLYGVANRGATTPTRIIEINKANGTPTDLGTAVTPGGTFIPDIEGFSIDEDGNWLLSTGKDGDEPVTDNTILKLVSPINDATVQDRPAVFVGDIGSVNILLNGNSQGKFDDTIGYWDWESLSCYNVSDETASIGDYTWLDTNGDGLQDGGEPPAPDVSVTLWASVDGAIGGGDDWEVGTLTTDVNGNYTFPVPPGNYFLKFDPALDYTLQNNGGSPPVGNDSDPDPSGGDKGQTALTTLTADEHDVTWDAGLLAASVGDFVWLDTDGNGLQDTGEPGIPGITVKIFADGDDPDTDPAVGETVTDENGLYGFTVPPGDYFIQFEPAATYTTQNNGGSPPVGNDSDASTAAGTNGETATFTLVAGANDTTWDAGLVAALLGDFVWFDSDPNGQQDSGEPGVAGVKVEVWTVGDDDIIGTVDDAFVAETYTDEDGAYEFLLPPGNYYVRFQNDLSFTTQYTGPSATDSDANPSTGYTGQIPLASGDVDDTRDAGVTAVATIGDKVWSDLDLDGVQDGGEPGLDGVRVNLYKPGDDGIPGTSDDIFVAQTDTAGGGLYSFTVAPGDYFLEFVASTGYSFSPRHQGTDAGADSDPNISTGLTSVTTLDPLEDDDTWDAGLYDVNGMAVGNIIWNDTTKDGVLGVGESGIAGVTVYLFNSTDDPESDPPVATVFTDGTGRYLFPNVSAGDYFVAIRSDDSALSGTPNSTVGGNHPPDDTGDHAAPDGDDGVALPGTAWIISQDFVVAAGGQADTGDTGDPINVPDDSAFMTIDFGLSASPTAIGLGGMDVQVTAVPAALLAALFMLLAATAFFVLRSRSYEPGA